MLIRYYGNIGGESGYADAAREFCMSMLAADLDFEISASAGRLPNRYLPLASHIRDRRDLYPHPDVVIVHTMPLSTADVLNIDQIEVAVPRARRIAYTTWEGSGQVSAPIASAMSRFHEVWVPCQANLVDFTGTTDPGAQTPSPLHLDPYRVAVVPHAYSSEGVWGWAATEPKDTSGTYRFYYIGVCQARKNVDGLVRAYLRAFTPADNVQLVIQSAGAPSTAVLAATVAATGQRDGHPSIAFSSTRLTDEEILTVHERCHCYVTATRGEAWNLPAFHAMLAGNHVIYPEQMGHDDFLRETSCQPYASRLVPAHGELQVLGKAGDHSYHAQYLGAQGLSCKNDWREPDLIELAMYMRKAYAERRILNAMAYDPASRYSRAAVGWRIRDLLENV